MSQSTRNSARTTASYAAVSARPTFDDEGTINEAPSASFGSLSLPWQTIAALLDGEASTAFREFVPRRDPLTVAERACREIVSLPLWPGMPESALAEVVERVREFY